ncbi:MAG: hypothetical protein QOJ19_1017 [Acidimicrobiia bacterium]|nr:hypothetical protein [Acidimicrobiia bacterium]
MESPDARRAEWTFTPAASSVPESRNLLRAFVAEGLSPEALDVAALLLTELTTNAVLHAATPYQVSLELCGAVLRVGVSDRSEREAKIVVGRRPIQGGMGLRLLAQLASRWGIDETATEPAGRGKTVWFEVDEEGGSGSPG